MTAPRLEIDLDKIAHNARTLVARLAGRGISVTGVTKATLGSPLVARALLGSGVARLGDSRVENLARLRGAGVTAPLILIRSPMLSQVDEVVRVADTSCNTDPDVIDALSAAAGRQGRTHRVVLMVELGDLREGLLPHDVPAAVGRVLSLPHLAFAGIGTNLACQSGTVPDATNLGELSALADAVDARFGTVTGVVSGGNSASLHWALEGPGVGRVNDLRLGESILLGRETLHRGAIDGLHTDAVALVAEVIESRLKPSRPWGRTAQTAFGEPVAPVDRGVGARTLLAVGRQDTDPAGLAPPSGLEVIGASSDHLVLATGGRCLAAGTEVAFGVDYSALVRAMTSPFVTQVFTGAV